MKQIKWFVPLAVGLLAACSSETSEQLASAAPSRASGEDFAAAAASSPIAAQIFNSPQEQDILSSSRQAMAEDERIGSGGGGIGSVRSFVR
uniref:Lipoprotein n=1 Tax=Conchiformibius kuhniae TaxID=211502 RepID=A0A8T9MUY1_9NEIS|nr:hypothetical protein LVJ77_04845 [Conchiformibius kuhniae]